MTFTTPDLCDENEGKVQVLEPIFENFGGRRFFGGAIVTVKCHEDNSRVKELVSTPGKGRVLVVDGGGSMRCALLGDMLAAEAAEHGWSGMVIYGCIRDVDALGDVELGVVALGINPLKSMRRGVGDVDVPVCFGGVTFRPGEYVYADNNGVIISAEPLIGPPGLPVNS